MGVEYRLVGTAAAVVQGVPISASDIDILVRRREDVDRLDLALRGVSRLDSPMWLPDAQQYFARYLVDGIDVEISTVEFDDTGLTECAGAAPWDHFASVRVGRHVVLCVSLELRLVTEVVRGRREHVDALTSHLRSHGCRIDLVQQSMTDRAIPPNRQAEIRRALTR